MQLTYKGNILSGVMESELKEGFNISIRVAAVSLDLRANGVILIRRMKYSSSKTAGCQNCTSCLNTSRFIYRYI